MSTPNQNQPNRRQFLKSGLATTAAAGTLASSLTAASYARVVGANERIRTGQIGCGGRAWAHIHEVQHAAEATNTAVVAVCDVWQQKRDAMAVQVEKIFGAKPQAYQDYRKLLEDPEIDAVSISTPDHQHCGQLIDAVNAGKDVYVEKPICMNIEELNRAYDVVKASKAIVQHGTQGRSDPGTWAAREYLAAAALGKLFRVETWISLYKPYWNNYASPAQESDTDWKGFLYTRKDRPFDADQHGAWMGYHDFSSGPIGGWMSHFSDFVHASTGCGFPTAAICHGGIFAPTSDPRRTAPDTVTCMLDYSEGFCTQFTTHFGSSLDMDKTQFLGEKGVMRTKFGHGPGLPVVSGEGSDHPQRLTEEATLQSPEEVKPMSNPDRHVLNWLQCIRSRQEPRANMDAGYKQGVAVVLGDLAYTTGRKMIFDPDKREIRPA